LLSAFCCINKLNDVFCIKFSKMKTTILGLFVILLMGTTIHTYAQGVTNCGYIIPKKKPNLKSSFKSVYEARDIVKAMLDTIKWKENFTLQEKNGINNAYATVINNKRWIIYDNDFLESLDEYAATKWASISVMAHEMGHHKFNHVLSGKGSTVPTEIEADEFSGNMMCRLGATLAQSIAAMQSIATDQASTTHPAKKDRIAAITKGWNKAAAELKAGGAKPPPPPPPAGTGGNGTNGNGQTGNGNTQTDPETDPTWIGLTMQSNRDETVQLSDDGKTYSAAVIKANSPFIFKFEIYDYGYLKLKYFNGYRTYKLLHGKDYSILWNRRTKNWTVVEVP
jgi:hypothetical protein